MAIRTLGLALAAVFLMGAEAKAPTVVAPPIVAPSPAWAAADAPRQTPGLVRIGTLDCLDQACSRDLWLKYLAAQGLGELQAPPGGRAYRWLWAGTDSNGPVGVRIVEKGFVEVTIDAAGSATMKSSWSNQTLSMDGALFAPFEAALAKTKFAVSPSQIGVLCVDECQDQLMEAVVDGRYHYVARSGGISEAGVKEAGIMLEQIARNYGAQP